MIRYLDVQHTEEDTQNMIEVDTDGKDHVEPTPDDFSQHEIAVNVGVPRVDSAIAWGGQFDWYGVNLGPDSVAALIAQLQSWQRREVFCNE